MTGSQPGATTGKTSHRRAWFQVLRRVLFWGLPVIILYFVFRQIDFAELKAQILRTNLLWLSFGVGVYSFTILIAALRWHVLLRQNLSRNVPLGFTVKHHWIGLALGTFVPGQIGADVYRALASTRRFGHFGLNVSIVLVQKILTLMTCMALIVLLYPVVSVSFPPEIERVHQLSYIMFLGTLLLIIVAAIALRSRLLSGIETRLQTYLANMRRKTANMLDLEIQERDASLSLRTMLKPWGDPGQLLPGLAFSIAFMLVAAARSQIFFRALGYDLPFAINLFASPVLVVVFTLPISFGSFGIREAAFILVYGLFGVPAEVALSVSFFNLFGILLNSLIGGVVMLASSTRIRDGTVVVSRNRLRTTDQSTNEDPEHAD